MMENGKGSTTTTVETYPMLSSSSEMRDAKPAGFVDESVREEWRVHDLVGRLFLHSIAGFHAFNCWLHCLSRC